MSKTRELVSVLLGFFLVLTMGCKTIIQEPKQVYDVAGGIINEEGSEFYKRAGLELMLLNYQNKSISKFQVSFRFVDEHGVPFDAGMYEIIGNVEPKGLAYAIINVDKYFLLHDPNCCFVDYLFVNKIVYEDGSEYNDPFGLLYFSNLED